MESLVGRTILEQWENSMSITSSNCETHKSWKIILDEGETVVAELKSTNKFMYSGNGTFHRFKKTDLTKKQYKYEIKLLD